MSVALGESGMLAEIAEEAWDQRCRRGLLLLLRSGRRIDALPRAGLDGAEATARDGRSMLARLARISPDGLSTGERITHGFLKWLFERDAEAVERWHESFSVTPYMAFSFSIAPKEVMAPFAFEGPADAERYLSLLADYAGTLRDSLGRLEAQAERGWRIPRPALPTVRKTLTDLKAALLPLMRPPRARLGALGAAAGFLQRVEDLLARDVAPAFDALLEAVGDDYAAEAGDRVGLCNLPGGDAAYRRHLGYHLSYDAEPERIHAIGLSEVARLVESMARLRARMGGEADEVAFHRQLRADPRSYAESPDALEAIYRGHMARMAERLPSLFRSIPKAPYDVRRLDPALEAGMSFGYYQTPTKSRDPGIYYYNGSRLDERIQLNAAPLIFHELAPGHHFHLASQMENEMLPTIRREAIEFTAFNEGWAEYAASLGDELDLYEDPYDTYGYLLDQRFIAQRMVVDTGMNALGWTLDRARAYMRANTMETDTFIASETLRYSTDLPAQALTYSMGVRKFREVRANAEARLGSAFDVKDFHDAVLSEGAMPLSLFEAHLADWTEGRRSASLAL